MNLEKIYPSTDTGAQAIGKLEINQNMLNQGIISNENKINVLTNRKMLPCNTIADERTIGTNPKDYSAGLYTQNLKNADAVGLESYGKFAHIIGYNSWIDKTAIAHEIAFINGHVLIRKSKLDKWDEWYELASMTKLELVDEKINVLSDIVGNPLIIAMNGGDANEMRTTTRRFIFNVANIPTGTDYGFLEVYSLQSGGFSPSPDAVVIQRFTTWYDASVYTRVYRKSDGVYSWSKWMLITEITRGISFSNGWSQFNGHQYCKVTRIGDKCTLHGLANKGVTSQGTIILTVPELFRPTSIHVIVGNAYGFYLYPSGDLVLTWTRYADTESWYALDGLTWEVD